MNAARLLQGSKLHSSGVAGARPAVVLRIEPLRVSPPAVFHP
jgi:hypothetical protein